MSTIFALTLREVTRRRVAAVIVVVTLTFTALAGWGFDRFAQVARDQGMGAPQLTVLLSQLLVMVTFMFSFILGMTAVFVAAPAVAGDVESGVMLAIVARPIRRSDVLIGKWLASALVLVAYGVAGSGLILLVVAWTSGYVPPAPLAFLAYLAAETVIGVTLATLLSTFVPPMAGGAIAVACFGVAWVAGVASSVGALLDNDALVRVSTITRLLLPTDGLWRGAMYHLEPSAVVLALTGAARGLAGNPFLSLAPPPAAYLAWCVAWTAGILGAALWVFRRREL